MVNWTEGQLIGFESRTAKNKPVENSTLHSGPESDLHEKIIQHCRQNGWIYFHGSMAHRAMRTKGENDFHLLLPGGVVIFIECKTAKGKLTPEQLGLSLWMEKLGHKMHVVRSFTQFLLVAETILKERNLESSK